MIMKLLIIDVINRKNGSLYLMMPFFNWNWARACRGHWAGPGLLAGWVVCCWTVWAEIGSLQR